MNKDTQDAFVWIITILRQLNIPFQITGGLAAIAYGATRHLVDIDIDIPEDRFSSIKVEVENFIIYGPSHFQDDCWDITLMTLNYRGNR